jgi:hypothetical protein
VAIVNRIVSAVVALALLVGGVLVAVEIVVAAFGRDPWVVPHDRWHRATLTHSWDGPATRWVCIGLILAGLLLLGLQAARRRATALPLGAGPTRADIGRRSLERSLARAAARVDGVARARARVRPGRAEVVAVTNRRRADELRPRLAEAVEQRLRSLALAQAPEVRVRVHARGDR